MPTMSDDPRAVEDFVASLGGRDPNTLTTYRTTVRHFVAWLAQQPGGAPFHPGLLTETAIRHYMEALQQASRAPRTRSKALAALRRFGQWAVDEGYLRRNPARAIPSPTVVALAPKELSDQQRYVLGTMVERYGSPRFDAIFALGYWAGLRISEIAALRLDQCHLNQRAGSITLVDSKGGKTRTLDLHTRARRALLDYLAPADPRDASRDPESAYVFTSQRAAWLRHKRRPDHLSERGIEHLWTHFKRHGTYDEWQLIEAVAFHDLRHDFAHRARASGWPLEEIAVYLGHQTNDGAPAIATTARYTLPSRTQIKERLQSLPG